MAKSPVAKPSFFDKLWQSIKSVFGGTVKKSTKFRKLTKAEHEKLGLKPSSKRYVRDDLKRITKNTRTISQRKAIEANGFSMVNRETGATEIIKGVSKEKRTATRQKKVPGGIRYFNLKKSDFARIAKKADGKFAQIIAHGVSNAPKYRDEENGPSYHATMLLNGDELEDELKRMFDDRGDRLGFSASNLPDRVDVYIQTKSADEQKAMREAKASLKKSKKKSKHSKRRGK